jgi:hypothetical protein
MPLVRQHYYAESLGDSVADDDRVAKVTLTFTPDADSDYLFVWSAIGESGSNNRLVRFWLTNVTDSIEMIGDGPTEPRFSGGGSNNSNIGYGGFAVASFGASPGEKTFTLYFASDVDANFITVNDANILAIKLGANDVFATDSGGGTSTGDTDFHDNLSLTISSSGTYLVLGSSNFNIPDSNSARLSVQLLDGSTAYGLLPNWWLQQAPSVYQHIVSLDVSGSKTIKMQHAQTGGSNTVAYDSGVLVALKLGDFRESYYDDERDPAYPAVGSPPVNVCELAHINPNPAHHWIIGCAGYYTDGHNLLGKWKLTYEGGERKATETWAGDESGYHLYFGSYRQHIDHQDVTWGLEASMNTGPSLIHTFSAALAVIELGDVGDVGAGSGSGGGQLIFMG